MNNGIFYVVSSQNKLSKTRRKRKETFSIIISNMTRIHQSLQWNLKKQKANQIPNVFGNEKEIINQLFTMDVIETKQNKLFINNGSDQNRIQHSDPDTKKTQQIYCYEHNIV